MSLNAIRINTSSKKYTSASSSSSSISAMIMAEYGVVDAMDFVEEIREARRPLIDKVREYVDGAYAPCAEAYRLGKKSYWLDRDDTIRFSYAWEVAHSMRWSKEADLAVCKPLFVALRMAKCWDYVAQPETVENIISMVSDFGLNLAIGKTVWQLSTCHLVDMAVKGLSLSQMRDVLVLFRDICSRGDNVVMSNFHMKYSQGIHHGDWLDSVIGGIRNWHIRHWNRFMYVFRHTYMIHTRLTHRFIRVLSGLDIKTLEMTVSDIRNWKGASTHSRAFRLAVVVREVADWQPMRLSQKRQQTWLSKFGRIPAKKEIYMLPLEVVCRFDKKSFSAFMAGMKETPIHNEGEHGLIALAKLCIWFGKGWEDLFNSTGVSNIHDFGINIPIAADFDRDQQIFVRRYIHRFNDAYKVVGAWTVLIAGGINPLAKEGMLAALVYLETLRYDNVMDMDFAIEAAKHGVSQENFEKYQDRWMSRDKSVTWLPKVSMSSGDFKFYRLDRDDVRGPFLGHYTGCCQHPDGAGASCAMHGALDPMGSFVVLEYRGDIKFQSWVWRSGDDIVFDNIEGAIKDDLYEEARQIYLEGINAFKGRLMIGKCYVGVNNSDIRLDGKTIECPCRAPGRYTDASYVWEV